MESVVKAVWLNLSDLSDVKRRRIDALFGAYLAACNTYLGALRANKYERKFDLQAACYSKVRKGGLHSQLAVDACKDAWIVRKHDDVHEFKYQPIRFNVPRSGSIRSTKRGNPVAVVNGIALPLRVDGGFRRFRSFVDAGYAFSQMTLHKTKSGRMHLLITLKKDFVVQPRTDVVVGVDVGTNCLAAVSVVRCGRPVKQLYFGRDLFRIKRDLGVRRTILQAKNTTRARRALKGIRGYECRLNKTRCYQTAHEIVALAKEHNASVALEHLKHLNRTRLGRKSNRKVKRMPYAQFRQALESVAWQNGIPVIAVQPHYTSQTCGRCGCRGSRRGAVFKCPECGMVVNSDRNASVNIALRAEQTADSIHPISFQIPQGGMPVSASVPCREMLVS